MKKKIILRFLNLMCIQEKLLMNHRSICNNSKKPFQSSRVIDNSLVQQFGHLEIDPGLFPYLKGYSTAMLKALFVQHFIGEDLGPIHTRGQPTY